MSEPQEPRQAHLDARNLRGIAHPLRVRMLGMLRADGPATASGLAGRLGLNTGATSYHLRQLAEHGFIRELPDRGLRRERWWEAAHADTAFPEDDLLRDESGLGASFLRSVGQVAADNMLRAVEARPTLPAEWRDAEDFSDYLLTLTPAEAKELAADIHAVLRARAAQRLAGQEAAADAIQVTFQFQLIPNLQPGEGR